MMGGKGEEACVEDDTTEQRPAYSSIMFPKEPALPEPHERFEYILKSEYIQVFLV